ncbi:MAG TPA: antibiotic biosynthesis monooxygenase family protein [Ktedonobacteraceae bacterium]|nr:antibiotic biosynthesis monooxygenase family protein [Ktedonobacteraceae bacterium]
MIALNATFLVAPGYEEQAIEILLMHVEQAKKEPGVLVTHVYRSRTEPRRFFIYHELNSQATFAQHSATLHYGKHILTSLYGMLEPESLLMDTYDLLTPTASNDLEQAPAEESMH